MNKPFWETKSLDQMTFKEWELLCDRCGWCCLHKFEDDAGEVRYSNVACRLFDIETCTCTDYENRSAVITDCTPLTPKKADEFDWLPESCAYRLIHNKIPLADWHPLIVGNTEKMNDIGINVSSFAISENDVDMDHIEDHIAE